MDDRSRAGSGGGSAPSGAVESGGADDTPEGVVPGTTTSGSPAPTAETRSLLPHGQGPAPTGLTIPDIGVQETLIELGIAEDGTAEVPQDYARAGWFAGGGRPGGIGPTVLLGHVDSLDGPAVFYRLRDLTVGAVITVDLADGSQARYQVRSTEQYTKAEFPTLAVYGATPRDVLTLITCGGPFDSDALSYTDNVVVTADRV